MQPGAHLHVRWRENTNGARSKSLQENIIPVDEFVMLYYERYHALRAMIRGAIENPLLFVNIGKNLGSGMTPRHADSLFEQLCVRPGIRRIHPHMFRHAFATSSGGAPLDVMQALLGHQSIHSTSIYNLDEGVLRRAIAAVLVPSNGR